MQKSSGRTPRLAHAYGISDVVIDRDWGEVALKTRFGAYSCHAYHFLSAGCLKPDGTCDKLHGAVRYTTEIRDSVIHSFGFELCDPGKCTISSHNQCDFYHGRFEETGENDITKKSAIQPTPAPPVAREAQNIPGSNLTRVNEPVEKHTEAQSFIIPASE